MKVLLCIGFWISWSLAWLPSTVAGAVPLLEVNSTDPSCVPNIFGGLHCTSQTRVTATNGEYSDLAFTVACNDNTVTDVWSSPNNCTCGVAVTDDQGRIRNGCSCELCPSGNGPSDFVVDCQGDFVVAECSSIDCNNACNGTCTSNCLPTTVNGTQTGDLNGTAIPTASPSIINGTISGTEAPTSSNVTIPDANDTALPTFSPTGTNETIPGANETAIPTLAPRNDTAVPTLAPAGTNGTAAPTMTNETGTGQPTVSPSNETTVPTLSPNTTLPPSNYTVQPTLAPTSVNETLSPGTNETLVPTASPTNMTSGNDTVTAQPTLAPTGMNGTVPSGNETGTFAPTSAPTNMTLSDVNGTAPTLAPTFVNETSSDNQTLAPTPYSNTTLVPTIAPTGINATSPAPTRNDTDAGTPTRSPTFLNATYNETQTPTLSPSSAPTNATETSAPSPASNSTFIDSDDNATLTPTTAPSPPLIPESDDIPTAMPNAVSSAPTQSPSRSSNATAQTSQPTGVPDTPASEVQVFEFSGISMRLVGVGLSPLTPTGKTAFEVVTENFYKNAYRSATTRRRLQSVESFDTEVTVIGDQIDSTGNTITYDQTLRFIARSGSLDDIGAADILLVPLSGNELRRVYLQALKDSSQEFESVTSINTPSLPAQNRAQEDESGGIDTLLLIFIIVGGVLFCCSCFIAVALVRRCSGGGGGGGEAVKHSGQDLNELALRDDDRDDDYVYGDNNIGMSQMMTPFSRELNPVPATHDPSNRSADDFFMDPSEHPEANTDRVDVFDDEMESGHFGDEGQGQGGHPFGLGGISQGRRGGRRSDDDVSDSNSQSGGSYSDSGSDSGSGSESGSESGSSYSGSHSGSSYSGSSHSGLGSGSSGSYSQSSFERWSRV